MKKSSSTLSLVALLLSTVSVLAGPPPVMESKNVMQSAPPEIFGTGPYVALDLGANVYQDRGGDRTFTDERGDTLSISPKNDVGFYGGIKGGWVFGTGVFRPTIEADLFYNGFKGGADGTITLADGAVLRGSTGSRQVNTGAFMSNFIAKFAFGRFQPYFGAGVGVYYAESASTDITTPRGTFSTGGQSHTDLAWQVIAGADYYWNPKFSTFVEYHYLDYTSSQIETSESRDLGQHLIGAGVRFHF